MGGFAAAWIDHGWMLDHERAGRVRPCSYDCPWSSRLLVHDSGGAKGARLGRDVVVQFPFPSGKSAARDRDLKSLSVPSPCHLRAISVRSPRSAPTPVRLLCTTHAGAALCVLWLCE